MIDDAWLCNAQYKFIHNHVVCFIMGYDNVVQIEVTPLQTVFHGKGGNVQFTISSTHSSCQKKGQYLHCGEKWEMRILKGD